MKESRRQDVRKNERRKSKKKGEKVSAVLWKFSERGKKE